MYLFGARGHAKVIIDILRAENIEINGLVDDNSEINELCGYPVFHNRSGLFPIIVSVGKNSVRKKIVHQLKGEFGRAIHPSAIVSDTAVILEGTVVMQGAIIQTETKIGAHCIINTGASIDHECTIEDYVHISPHATLCGNVTIGEGTWIGAGSTIIQGIKIGNWCIIGAGTVVTKDIPDNVVAYGSPCKIVEVNKY